MPRPPTRDIWPLADKRLSKNDPDFDFRLQKLLDQIEAHGPHEDDVLLANPEWAGRLNADVVHGIGGPVTIADWTWVYGGVGVGSSPSSFTNGFIFKGQVSLLLEFDVGAAAFEWGLSISDLSLNASVYFQPEKWRSPTEASDANVTATKRKMRAYLPFVAINDGTGTTSLRVVSDVSAGVNGFNPTLKAGGLWVAERKGVWADL